MKKTFTTIDVLAIVEELKNLVIGLRVNQIYNIDHKTYLIKLQKPDHKVVVLLESASRIHTTEYDWPKSPAPSGFAMKLRKHLRNKRLECVEQLGVDRVVDLTFGFGEAMHHLIVELYDRGNVVLTDGEYTILNVLRPHKEGEDTKIIVNQKYPLESARKARDPPSLQELETALQEAKENFALKKILNPLLDCGGSLLDHELLKAGFPHGAKRGKIADMDIGKIYEAARNAQLSVISRTKTTDEKKGYIIKKLVKRTKQDGSSEDVFLFEEFHPQLYGQHEDSPVDEFLSFNKACDEFFSNLEANELDKKAVQKEKEALKKLENVRKDHERRLRELKDRQETDMKMGQLIELNQQLVEGALLVVRSAIANQIDWRHIQELLDEAQTRGDPIASAIRALKLGRNTITLWLSDPYDCDKNDMFLDSDEEREEGTESEKMRPLAVDINLDLSALANARRYYNMKRQAAKKEQKTIDASYKAIKSAEKKTQQTLKEVSTIANINKARKVHWFEKYFWFISSENYLVIGGRDSQQNEQVVKRHLKPKDIYVHADLHGASSIVIKNPNGGAVPPRTLHEAGIMALCYSRAWDEKVVTSAWWVWGQQVSKTAPTGEYLTTGAFMVRGKKNFLPPSHLVYGFGFMFRLEESSIQRHEGERKIRMQDEEFFASISDALEKLSADSLDEKEVEIPVEDENEIDSDNGDESGTKEPSQIEVEEADTREDEHEEMEDNSESTQQFPDTELEIEHLKGDQFTLKARIDSVSEDHKEKREVFLGDDKPVIISLQPRKNKKENKQHEKMKKQGKDEEDKGEKMRIEGMKRGQKGKLKKMKKYKDQDEEERELRMQLLQSSGTKKQKDKGGKKKRERKPKPVGPPQNQPKEKMEPETIPKNKDEDKKKEEMADENEDDDDVMQAADDLSILNALTAIPSAEDELLYAIPICAPYSSMTNYKFKIKLTPGTGKKGKACKTGLHLFTTDRMTSSREKDLLRAVKDYDLGKNVPGKVKVSAPNISKIKK